MDKIDYGKIADKIEAVLSNIEAAESIREIRNIKKMTGYKSFTELSWQIIGLGLN
ncbi:hypothetical protein [Pelobium manganitolerans]|uniref:hypothetical protein n=1 Tax=Pelobium manganitolerans TaxID=1842495 RepID=UPI0015FF9ECB|nr:hypothetical protein [Pelobium manganitolerans]